MPIELKIYGDTPADFAKNLASVLALSFPRMNAPVAAPAPYAGGIAGAVLPAAAPEVDRVVVAAPEQEPVNISPDVTKTTVLEAGHLEVVEGAAAKRRGRPKKTEAKPAPEQVDLEAAIEANEPLVEPKVVEPEPEPAVTREDVKAALLVLQEAKGETAVLDAIRDFGAAKFSQIKPDDYAALIERAVTLAENN
jgi:hypothetical protein